MRNPTTIVIIFTNMRDVLYIFQSLAPVSGLMDIAAGPAISICALYSFNILTIPSHILPKNKKTSAGIHSSSSEGFTFLESRFPLQHGT